MYSTGYFYNEHENILVTHSSAATFFQKLDSGKVVDFEAEVFSIQHDTMEIFLLEGSGDISFSENRISLKRTEKQPPVFEKAPTL